VLPIPSLNAVEKKCLSSEGNVTPPVQPITRRYTESHVRLLKYRKLGNNKLAVSSVNQLTESFNDISCVSYFRMIGRIVNGLHTNQGNTLSRDCRLHGRSLKVDLPM
jgi:hypothetical protein